MFVLFVAHNSLLRIFHFHPLCRPRRKESCDRSIAPLPMRTSLDGEWPVSLAACPRQNPELGERGETASAKTPRSHCEETEASFSIMGLIHRRLPSPTECDIVPSRLRFGSPPLLTQRRVTSVPNECRSFLLAPILLPRRPRRSFDAATMHSTAVRFVRNIVGSLGSRTNDLMS
jgi:hypothetical protein